jgi:predicted transcriptional regulator
MVKEKSSKRTGSPTSSDLTVYGHLDSRTVEAIDRLADQMLMPRSWVVSQILREWSERRSLEINELEESWNGSYREEVGEKALEGPCDDCRPI